MADFMQTKTEDIPTPEWLPVVCLNNAVLFPGATAPIAVTSEDANQAIEIAVRGNRLFAAVAIREPEEDFDNYSHLYSVGTIAFVMRMMRGAEDMTQLVVRGVRKRNILELEIRDDVP
ncbi:MAG: LON peptidase substrate-binding domain-containing protein, partial [bacterium]|nr:LON peptidase substrate-binding domain-containing protein [bacterium]